jgi:hypothetical protein
MFQSLDNFWEKLRPQCAEEDGQPGKRVLDELSILVHLAAIGDQFQQFGIRFKIHLAQIYRVVLVLKDFLQPFRSLEPRAATAVCTV